jgi:peptidoglycan L-alanyl-D-glutamate endopeptidase CwlK
MKQEYGYEMVLIEGYRSADRQAFLDRQPQRFIENQRDAQALHLQGLAADSAFLYGGKLVLSDKDPYAKKGYEYFGEIAKSVGLAWGGDWKTPEWGHAELRRTSRVQQDYNE